MRYQILEKWRVFLLRQRSKVDFIWQGRILQIKRADILCDDAKNTENISLFFRESRQLGLLTLMMKSQTGKIFQYSIGYKTGNIPQYLG